MPWERTRVRYWTVCWAWIFPYPCRKTKYQYCCTGHVKKRCYGFFGERWLCCSRKESHNWIGCFGFYDRIYSDRICHDNIPEERDSCPATVGDAPPGSGSPGSGTNYLRNALSVGSGTVFWGVVGTLIALAVSPEELLTGAIGGAITGAVFGAGSGRRWGWLIWLIVLVILLLLIWLGMI
jgi:hypothetical protein